MCVSVFPVFARLHPVGRFPTTSLMFMGALASVACLFSLEQLISVLIVVQAAFQFAAQCIAVMLLRHTKKFAYPYHMPLYPLPAVIALLGWIFIVASSGTWHIVIGLTLALAGLVAYFLKAIVGREWPFERA